MPGKKFVNLIFHDHHLAIPFITTIIQDDLKGNDGNETASAILKKIKSILIQQVHFFNTLELIRLCLKKHTRNVPKRKVLS